MHDFATLFYLSFLFDIFNKYRHSLLLSFLFFSIFLALGTGSQILIYDLNTGNMIKSLQVFEGIRVHGISCTIMNCIERTCFSKLDFKIAVFGERRVKIFSLSIDIATHLRNQAHVSVDLILHQLLPKFNHWVLDVCFLEVRNSQANIIPVLLCVFSFSFSFLISCLQSLMKPFTCGWVVGCDKFVLQVETMSCYWMQWQHCLFLGYVEIVFKLWSQVSWLVPAASCLLD